MVVAGVMSGSMAQDMCITCKLCRINYGNLVGTINEYISKKRLYAQFVSPGKMFQDVDSICFDFKSTSVTNTREENQALLIVTAKKKVSRLSFYQPSKGEKSRRAEESFDPAVMDEGCKIDDVTVRVNVVFSVHECATGLTTELRATFLSLFYQLIPLCSKDKSTTRSVSIETELREGGFSGIVVTITQIEELYGCYSVNLFWAFGPTLPTFKSQSAGVVSTFDFTVGHPCESVYVLKRCPQIYAEPKCPKDTEVPVFILSTKVKEDDQGCLAEAMNKGQAEVGSLDYLELPNDMNPCPSGGAGGAAEATARQRDGLPLNQEGHMYQVSSLHDLCIKGYRTDGRQTNGLPLNQEDPMYQVSSLHDLCIKGYRTDGKAEGLTAHEPGGSYVPSFKSPRPLYQRLSHRRQGRRTDCP
ncbi:hypothetical protein J6590_029121 [Homalodisca vitripennis]|nr:hypothetical protein J6590_029121 [Homalodisca vitripennis]